MSDHAADAVERRVDGSAEGQPLRREVRDRLRARSGDVAPRRHDPLRPCADRKPRQRVLFGRGLGVPPGARAARRRSRLVRVLGVRRRVPRRTRLRQRHLGRPSPQWVCRFRGGDRSPPSLRGAQRAAGRGAHSRRQPVVCGSRHLSKRLAAAGGAGPSVARPPGGALPRHRRTHGDGRGGRRNSQPLDPRVICRSSYGDC